MKSGTKKLFLLCLKNMIPTKIHDKKIIVCACASRDIIKRGRAAALAARLEAAGCEVALVDDLCGKVRDAAPEASTADGVVVAACYPRAVGALLDTLGVTPHKILDIRNESAEVVLENLGFESRKAIDASSEEEFSRLLAAMPREEGCDPWFPVIDKERCSECEKCHDFCLFGVYAIERGRVVVRNPENCKNNCPACARLCPSEAIIFPKYRYSPINGGTEYEEQHPALDTKAIYNEALRERLEARRAGVPLFKYDGR